MTPLRFVVLGSSIAASSRNAHAVTYRTLLRELVALGHDVLFLERGVASYYMPNDLPQPPFCRVQSYDSLHDLRAHFDDDVSSADVVIVGSRVLDGAAIGDWVIATAQGITAFYDVDARATLTLLERGPCPWITAAQVARYQLYLTCAGGAVLDVLEHAFGSGAARTLYPAFDASASPHMAPAHAWDLGCIESYGDVRLPSFERLMLDAARRWPGGRFVIAGTSHSSTVRWPANIERVSDVAAERPSDFYSRQRYSLAIAQTPVTAQLLEAAASGSAIISDDRSGIDGALRAGEEFLLARSAREVVAILVDLPEQSRRDIAEAARARILRDHTPVQRARQLLDYVLPLSRVVTAV